MAGGFTDDNRQQLKGIHQRTMEMFTYESDSTQWGVPDYWENDQWLLPAAMHNAPFKADCEAFAMVCMRKAIEAGYKARLIVCLTELKEGHAICEVVSEDGTQAYYFDNRRHVLATRQSLIGYYFYSASPWNPTPGDKRPWYLIDQQAA